ncbi:MAG: TatD family hydrolase [Bacteroidaceae bacterium]|nr:TatD family hydrolase [Bacteroidaceae bacterium]
MMIINDIHTHGSNRLSHAIESLSPAQFDRETSGACSIGIHPWDSDSVTTDDILRLEELSTHPGVVAIGECGIDRLRGADIANQTTLFEQHIILSERVKKPLIIHAVKATDIILSLHRKYLPKQTWIIHGYRGNAITAQQYIKQGIELSYGEKFNSQAVAVTPLEMLWIESDESKLDIKEIYTRVSEAINIEAKELQKVIERRAKKLFFGCE